MYKIALLLFFLFFVGTVAAAANADAQNSPAPSPASPPKAQEVVARMAAANPNLKTLKARVHFDIVLHAFIDVHPDLDATYYYRRPDKNEFVFDSLPELAKPFQHLYSDLGPNTLLQKYDVSVNEPASNANPRYVLKLVPKKTGNVDHLLLDVDAQDYAVLKERWYYRDGGAIVMEQSNARVGGYVLPKRQVADFTLPNYRAHVVTDFRSYEPNANFPDSVFTQSQ